MNPSAGSKTLEASDLSCDLLVIGTGMAGMAAGLFAVERGLSVVMAGSLGGIDYTTGYLDLLGVHPLESRQRCTDPWQGLDDLSRDCPEHPYSRLGAGRISDAFEEFTSLMSGIGLPFEGRKDVNVAALTAAGTTKLTYRVPRSMWKGVLAMEDKAPCLIVGLEGLKGFSSRQIVELNKAAWPDLRGVSIPFPGFRGELYPEHLAWALADPELVRALAERVRQNINGEGFVGLPAVLGPAQGHDVVDTLEALLGVGVFEVPTLPPSVPGLRMRSVLESALAAAGVTVLSQKMALAGTTLTDGRLAVQVGGDAVEVAVRADAVVHAGGRFFGKGLRADRNRVFEPVFDLPVVQPPERSQWHDPDFYLPGGHPLNRAGLECDHLLRPLGPDGRPWSERLFAAGSILAHQDWMRSRCGAGLSIATAHAVVTGLAKGRG